MSGVAISNVSTKSTQAVIHAFSGVHYKSREVAIGAVLGGILVGVCSLAYVFFRSMRKNLEPQLFPYTFGVLYELVNKVTSYKAPESPEYLTETIEELHSSSSIAKQVKVATLIQRYGVVLDKFAVWKALAIGVNVKKPDFELSKTSSLEEAEQGVESQFNQWLIEHKSAIDQKTRIDITSQNIKCLPEQIRCLFDMKGLTRLCIDYNALESLPESIAQLTNLHDLILGNNKFAILPSVICKLVNLETLELAENYLESLPDELSQLSKLYSLDLSKNKFKEIPKCLAKMTGLQFLKFGGNPCTNISDFCQLTRLYLLSFDGNGLETLPNEFSQLSELSEVDLSNNKFKEIPECLGKIPNLKIIHFGGNPCSEDSESVKQFKSQYPSIDIKFGETL